MIRQRDLWPSGRPANLPDVDATLRAHGDDGTGYCRCGCNLYGWQYPVGTCGPAKRAAEIRQRLLAAG